MSGGPVVADSSIGVARLSFGHRDIQSSSKLRTPIYALWAPLLGPRATTRGARSAAGRAVQG